MQKIIYFQGKPLYLANEIDSELDEYLHHEETIFIDDFSSHSVKAMIHEMEQDKILRGVFLHSDTGALLEAFKKKLTLIKAGGGLVVTPENEILLIFRKGKWDLPKGKLDQGESLEACALREVKEETGLVHVTSGKFICSTYHTYHENGKHIIKESHWYLMSTPGKSDLKPQEDEGITECKFVPKEEIGDYMDHTHASIRDVLNEGLKIISDKI